MPNFSMLRRVSYPGVVDYSGSSGRFLRQGYSSVKEGGILNFRWSRKWLILWENTITFQTNSNTPLKFTIHLADITNIDRTDSKPFCLLIQTKSRKLHLSFENEADIYEWEDDICARTSLPKPTENLVHITQKIDVDTSIDSSLTESPEQWIKVDTPSITAPEEYDDKPYVAPEALEICTENQKPEYEGAIMTENPYGNQVTGQPPSRSLSPQFERALAIASAGGTATLPSTDFQRRGNSIELQEFEGSGAPRESLRCPPKPGRTDVAPRKQLTTTVKVENSASEDRNILEVTRTNGRDDERQSRRPLQDESLDPLRGIQLPDATNKIQHLLSAVQDEAVRKQTPPLLRVMVPRSKEDHKHEKGILEPWKESSASGNDVIAVPTLGTLIDASARAPSLTAPQEKQNEEEREDGRCSPASSKEQGVTIPTLELLMRDRFPPDLSGQISIPDLGSSIPGGLADVYVGVMRDKQVAVKRLRIRKTNKIEAYWEESNERRLRREMHVWSALRHPNISEFLGFITGFGDYPAMISIWYQRGTVSEYLDRVAPPVNERLGLVLGISYGLQYLHNLKIIHGDLKPSNVLVDDIGAARLCDFGLVRLADWDGPAGMTTTSPYTGTERYKPPELFISKENRRPVATFEGDIYSLGCVILEVLERIYPFRRFTRMHELQCAIMDKHSPALRKETTHVLLGLTEYLWNLLEACWGEPPERPKVDAIVNTLESFQESIGTIS